MVFPFENPQTLTHKGGLYIYIGHRYSSPRVMDQTNRPRTPTPSPTRHPPSHPARAPPTPTPSLACPAPPCLAPHARLLLVVAWCSLAAQGRHNKKGGVGSAAAAAEGIQSNPPVPRVPSPRRHLGSTFHRTRHLIGSFLHVRTCSASRSLLCSVFYT
jgi:hypothetical protein